MWSCMAEWLQCERSLQPRQAAEEKGMVNIAVVDNDPDLLDKLTGIFRNMQDVNLLGRFEEAVAVVGFVKENQVDMVFTDIVMPDISGISLAANCMSWNIPPRWC